MVCGLSLALSSNEVPAKRGSGMMARINIEDSIHTDRRFYDLMMKLGDLDKTYGVLVRTWIIAQKWYLTENRMIPAEEWRKQLISEAVIETGWAERVGDYIRVSGADNQFAWLLQRVESGRKGGLSRRGVKISIEESAKRQGARIAVSKAVKSGDIIRPDCCSECGRQEKVQGHHSDYSKPLDVIWLCDSCHDNAHKQIELGIAKQPLSDRLATAKQPLAVAKPLFSSSSSSSLKKKNKISNEILGGPDLPIGQPTSVDLFGHPSQEIQKPAGKEDGSASQKAAQFIAAYVRAYQSRFPGSRPEDLNDRKVQGQIVNWIRGYPLARACELVQVYFQLEAKWFGVKGYDFITFRNNLNKVGQALDSGSDPDLQRTNWDEVAKILDAEEKEGEVKV